MNANTRRLFLRILLTDNTIDTALIAKPPPTAVHTPIIMRKLSKLFSGVANDTPIKAKKILRIKEISVSKNAVIATTKFQMNYAEYCNMDFKALL